MEVTFKPNKKQFLALQHLTDETTREIGYGGGASGGKSYLGCIWVALSCISNKDVGYVIGRKELTTLKKTTLITLFKAFKELQIKEGAYSYNQQNNVITFVNGSQIFLMDLDYKPSDPLYTRFGGLELTGAFIDESNECQEEAISIIRTRLGRRGTLKPKLLETFNPSKNHIYKRYYLPHVKGDMPSHRVFIPALATDNPYTSEDYIEQLKSSDPITRARLLDGNFEYDDDPNTLIKLESIYDLFTNTIADTPKKYLTADIARYGQDKTVIYCWQGLKVYKVNYYSKQDLITTATKIKEMLATEQIPYSHCIIDEDGVGGGVLDSIGGARGFMGASKPLQLNSFINGQKMFGNFTNLKAQCSFKLAEVINDHKMAIQIDDAYVKNALIEELQQIKQKNPDNDGKKAVIGKDTIKENIGRSPDFSDALMMRMYLEIMSPTANFENIYIDPFEQILKNNQTSQAKHTSYE